MSSDADEDFCHYVPDELIVIIMEFLIAAPVAWKYRDAHGSIESQRATAVCNIIGNFGAVCRRFWRIAQDGLYWRKAFILSGFFDKVAIPIELPPGNRNRGLIIECNLFEPPTKVPIQVRSLAHARLLFHPQVLFQVFRPGESKKITLFEGEIQPKDIILCKHVIPPTASQENEPTREFYMERAFYEHTYFPGRCYRIFYAVYVSTTEHGQYEKMTTYTNERFYKVYLAGLKVTPRTMAYILHQMQRAQPAVFRVPFGKDEEIWFTVKRMDVLRKPRRKKPEPKPNRKRPRVWPGHWEAVRRV